MATWGELKKAGITWSESSKMTWGKLKEFCTINPKAKQIPDDMEVSFVPMQRVSDTGDVQTDEIRKAADVKKGFTFFEEGDVLFAKITPCMENGKGGIAWGLKNGVGFGSTEFHVLHPDPEKVSSEWLYYLTSWDEFRKQCARNMTGSAGQKRVPKSYLEQYKVYIPSLEEQRRIAALLDKVSDLIAKRRAQLDKLDLLVKARFVELFGDPFINSMAWKKIKIIDAVTVEPQNGMYKPQSDYVTDGSGTPILRIDGFYDGVVTDFSSLKRLRCNDKEKQKYLLKENDIVINRVNSIEYLGKCAHITGLIEETVYESNMMRMHFDTARFNPVYITHLLCSRFVYDQVVNHAKKAVNQASINQKDVLDFDIYQPSIDLQNVFADFVNQVEQSKLKLRQSLDKLETLKKALMQQYFG
ncbi:restriction endonuclease subunit S [Flavonifractor sp. An4]|uniref:restriction endonuclease subunit S n=1 Tax=Flavonifractor sp. An4 TaxID=1965634 RepID=UPI000B394870|nr:restriction endonuclease subunit S [Flavonifractor sp. An4]OUO17954.1 hypothetical protein B5F94_00740 [Flavonifractor sp. An4]